MALSTIEEMMMLDQTKAALKRANNDDEVMMMLGMVDGELLFPGGTPTEFCGTLGDLIASTRPHLRPRIDAYIASAGQNAP